MKNTFNRCFGKAFAVLFAVVTFAVPVFAASDHDNISDKLDTTYSSILYDRNNGLPTSEANAVLQTSDGFIWIGSYSGLIRYDGTDFYRYDSSYGISSVICLYEDKKGRLWIGTNDNGVALYENGTFKLYGRADGLRSSSIRSLKEDAEGNIFIATTFGMAYIDTDDKLQIISDSQVDGEYIHELQADSEGTIYGITSKGNLFTIKNKQVVSLFSGEGLGVGPLNTVAADPDAPGCIYLGTENSEIIYADVTDDMRSPKIYSAAPQQNINAIVPVGDKIWICADNGIGYFTDDFQYSVFEDVPLNNSVDGMICDHEGNMWFVSSRQGVLKVASSLFCDISDEAGLGTDVVNSTCMYNNDLYIGTDRGLQILDQNYKSVENELTHMFKDVRIRCIKKTKTGDIWFCTFGELGLVCMHKDGSIENFNENDGFASNRFRTMAECEDGSIVVSCSGGVYTLKNGKIIKKYDNTNGISNAEVLCIENGEDGVLYFGSDGGGLYKADDNKITRLGLDDGLNSEVILKIKKDERNGVYWIITSNSIAYMADGKITTITNFPYSNNFDIYPDKNGGAWILSSNGIYVAAVESLIKNDMPSYLFYDTKCGLPCVATVNSSSELDDDGCLYIAGTTGVIKVNIDASSENTGNIKLTVPFVEADDVLYSVKGNSVTIPSDTKRLVIMDHALTYSLINPTISYQLIGFDDEPIVGSKQDMQYVSYTNLKGGKYTFRLAVINTLTGQTEESMDITIIKKKAFYEQIWFHILLTAAILSVLALIIRQYLTIKTRAIVKKQEETQEFVDEAIQAFAKCIDMKDKYTRGHSFRVALYSRLLAEKMGYSEGEADKVYKIALLHDIGKISIPDDILNKPGRATDEEYAVLKSHSQNGYEILKDIAIAPELAIGAGCHHERIDGKGYPKGLKDDEIPMTAQIIAVADTFDAMYSNRPYRKQLDISVVIEELKRVSGTQLNGDIVKHMLDLISEGKIGKKEETEMVSDLLSEK